MSKCAGGFELPKHGPCPECGAGPSDGCYRANAKAHQDVERLTRELAAKDAEIAGLRAKHYEECAVICDQQFSKSETLIERYINRGINICKTVIRAAAKQ